MENPIHGKITQNPHQPIEKYSIVATNIPINNGNIIFIIWGVYLFATIIVL